MRSLIAGFVVALGGTVAPIASANGQSRPSADERIAEATADTVYDSYKDPVFALPLGVGLRIPSYNRVDGVALPWGPMIRIPGGRVVLDPTVTYRSHLGKFDPALTATFRLGHDDQFAITGGTGTFTNDEWIRSNLLNSLAALGVGSDARNYFRADRINGTYTHSIETGPWTAGVSAGWQHEFDWSTGTPVPHTSAPWSFFGRSDSLKLRRINPAVLRSHITSGIAAVQAVYEANAMKTKFSGQLEKAFDAPARGARGDGEFTQVTLHLESGFPTFGAQSFAFRGHGVLGSAAPPQRYAYLGGAGTLATVDLLALGGDRLAYVEGEYKIPLFAPLIPVIGPPVISLRYAAGSAGIGELPDFIQNIGVGVGFKLVKIEYHVDPNYRKTPYTSKNSFSLGFSLSP